LILLSIYFYPCLSALYFQWFPTSKLILIGSTTTKKGLSVICRLDENHYETGLKITDEQKDSLNIIFNGPNEKWNYIIYPN